MRISKYGALLLGTLLACEAPRTASPDDSDPAPASAAEVMSWVRETKRAVELGPHASNVSLFVVPRNEARRPLDSRGPGSCLEARIQPASIDTIISTPDFGEVYASDVEGALLRQQDRRWTPVPTPADVPPIVALLGFARARSPLELVVGVDTGAQSALWTLIVAAGAVTDASPTKTDRPEYTDSVQFLRSHHTPTCREGDRDCLAWTEVDARTFIDLIPDRHAKSRQPMLELGGDVAVADVAWADAEGTSIYVAAAGVPCVVDASG